MRAGSYALAIVIGIPTFVAIYTVVFGVFPALVVDGERGFKAVRRSWRLARRDFKRSAVVIGSTLLSTWAVSTAIQLLTRIPFEPDGWGAPAGAYAAAVTNAVAGSASAVVMVSLYLQLREMAGEQMSSAELAARMEAFDSRTAPP